MHHSIPHDLPLPLLRQAAAAALLHYQARYPQAQTTLLWQDEQRATLSVTLRGVTLRAALLLTPSAIEVTMALPLLLRPFKERAQRRVESEVAGWLAQARAGTI